MNVTEVQVLVRESLERNLGILQAAGEVTVVKLGSAPHYVIAVEKLRAMFEAVAANVAQALGDD